ncbi:mitochondrial transcription rescue factor 1 [Maniola hyperantus]|uniref:mitochondrial transcription rescue factor 1 n=1 Tax=Aphantopus hyperantus TaxID=2795564 RepID=UPI00156897B3|nr:mitochondrial transcription rescue factor 1 [Maniola hyperantus]
MNALRLPGRLPNYLYGVLCKEIRPLTSLNISCLCNTLGAKTVDVKTLKPLTLSYNVIRQKSKKQKDEDSDDEDVDIFDGDSSLTKDSKVVKLNTTSLRMDAILKSTLGVARNKVEKLFYESKIRVNGKKILKKSIPVRVDYEIDVIKSVSPKNPDHLYVARIEILSITAKEDSIAITARRFKNLLIENYETDPYKPSTADEDK